MNRIFISYTRDDQDAARLIAERLRAAGFEVFYDVEAIVAGDSWSNKVRAALQDAAAVLVLLSSNSRRSSWVQDEVQTALESKTLIVPVLLDEGAKQNWLWPLVATRQSVSLDLRSPAVQEQLDYLVGGLASLTSKSPGSLSRGPEPVLTAPMRASIVWKEVAIGIVSAILGALVSWLLR
jgi:hypothetical protein